MTAVYTPVCNMFVIRFLNLLPQTLVKLGATPGVAFANSQIIESLRFARKRANI
jgi:hypothetical protein